MSIAEHLTNTFEQPTARLEHLGRRSACVLNEWLTALEMLLDRSISSQRAFNRALLDLFSELVSSGRSGIMLLGLLEGQSCNHQFKNEDAR